MARWTRILLTGLALAASHPFAQAQTAPSAVSAWYEALRQADAAAFEALLAQDARIDLRFLGVVQTRDEFIESLDAWADVAKGAEILTRTMEEGGDGAIVEVCYRFPSNEKVNREQFTLQAGKVVLMVQEETGQSCDGFAR